MTSKSYLQKAILAALEENNNKKYFLLLDKWNTVYLQDGRKFKVKIVEESEDK